MRFTSLSIWMAVFRIVAVLRDFAAEEDCFVFLTVGQRSQLAHTPFANHIARDVRGAFDVIASAGGDVAEENFFRRTPAISTASMAPDNRACTCVCRLPAVAWLGRAPCRAE